MGVDRTAFAGGQTAGKAALCATARSCRSVALSSAHCRALAFVATRFSEPFDGATLLLRLAGGGAVADDQFLAAAASPRTGRTRGQSVGRGDRQPIRQDHRKRRSTRFSCRQKSKAASGTF